MIKFVLVGSGLELDLYEKTRLKVKINNPAFDDKLQTGSYILPFSLPDTPNNRLALDFVNVPSRRGALNKSYLCDLWVGGLYFASGLLYINGYRNDEFSCDFSLDTGLFSKAIGDLSLRAQELDHDSITFERNVPYTYGYRHFFQGSPNEFDSSSIDMRMTLVLMDATYTNVITGFDSDIDTYYSETKSGTEVVRKAEWLRLFADKINKYNKEAIANQVPLSVAHSAEYHFAVEGIADGAGYYYFAVMIEYISAGVLEYYPLQHTTKNILGIPFPFEYTDFVFPRIENKDFYESSNPVDFATFKFKNSVFGGVLNNTITKNNISNFPQYVLRHNVLPASYNTDEELTRLYGSSFEAIVPMLKVGYIFRKIAQFTNYFFEGDFLNDSELQKLIVCNTYALDKISTSGDGTNVYDEQMNFVNHLPDVTIRHFMLHLSALFNFFYTFDFRQNTSKLTFRQDLLDAAIVDWTEKFLREFDSPVTEPKNIELGYSSSALPSGSENFFTPVRIGTFQNTDDKDFEAGTLPYRINELVGYPLPEIFTYDLQVGNSPFPVFNVGTENDYPLQFLFWRGEGQGVRNLACAYANNLPLNFNGANKYSLEWGGAKGLAEKWHKRWIEFLQNSQATKRKAWLTLNDLLTLDLNKRYAIDYQLYLIKSLDIEISNGDVTLKSPAEIELAQIL